jgi:prepilin-type processing-associated H-X9-DG protein
MPAQRTNYDFMSVTASDRGRCNWWKTAAPAARYMFGENSTTRIADVKDGTSNTFMLAETTVEPRCNGWGPVWGLRGWVQHGLDPSRNTGGANAPGINDWTLIASWTQCGNPTATGSNAPKLGRLGDWGRVGSYHAGGAQFAMGDGSVRFVQQNALASLLKAMSTVAGGEITPNN